MTQKFNYLTVISQFPPNALRDNRKNDFLKRRKAPQNATKIEKSSKSTPPIPKWQRA